MEVVYKSAVIELLKSGMLDADNTLVCDADECNSMLEWAIEEVQIMKPAAYFIKSKPTVVTDWIMREIEPGHLVREGEVIHCGECRFQNEVWSEDGQIKYCTLRCPMGEDDEYCSKGVKKDG